MSLSRLSFPFNITQGRLELAENVPAAQQAIGALLAVHPGELPLSRDYGCELEYNIPPELAYRHTEVLSQKLGEYHPHLELISMEPVLSEEGTVLDWAVEVGVQEV